MSGVCRVVSGPKILVSVSSTVSEIVEHSFAPGRTLFVATSWPTGADPDVYFTDVPSALAAAAALSPAPDVNNPALIVLHPGIYSAPVTLVSNVHLIGHNVRGCSITGSVTYAPSVGVNAAQAGLFERVYMGFMSITGAVSVDCTAKSAIGVGTTFDCRNVDLSGSLTHRGRALSGGQDTFETWVGVHGGSSWSFDGSVPLFYGGVQLGAPAVTIANCAFGASMLGTRVFGTINLVNTRALTGDGGNKFVNVNVDGTSVFGPVQGSKVGVVSVAAGGIADLRGAEYFTASNLQGAGAIDRSIWRTTFGPTTAGNNTVTLAPAYIDANYNVQLTQTAGTPTSVLVSGKQAGQFTLTDAAGGNTFDVTIIKE